MYKALYRTIILSTCGFISLSVSAQNISSQSVEKATAKQRFLEAKRLLVDGMPEDITQVENLLIDAIRIEPQFEDAYGELVRFMLWQISVGSMEPVYIYKASQIALQVNDMNPDRPLGAYLIAEILLAMGQQAQAIETYDSARKKFPKHEDTYAFEARFLVERDPKQALLSAQNALSLGHPMDDLSLPIAGAIAQIAAEKTGEEIEKFAAIYPDRWLYHRAGSAYLLEKKFDKAELAFKRAIALGNRMESRLQMAVMFYTHAKKPAQAVPYLQELIEVLENKENRRWDSVALAHAHLALAHLAANANEEAIKETKKSFELFAMEPKVLVTVFEEFQKKKLADSLVSSLQQVAESHPEFEYAHITLGNMAVSKKDFSSAVFNYTNALALSPMRDDLFSARAHVYYEIKNYKLALFDFENAIKNKPNHAAYHYNKACMLARLMRKDEAIDSLKVAVELNYEYREMALTDTDLAGLVFDNAYQKRLIALGVIPET